MKFAVVLLLHNGKESLRAELLEYQTNSKEREKVKNLISWASTDQFTVRSLDRERHKRTMAISSAKLS